MVASAVGECWEVLVRWSIFGFAVENVFQFETIPGAFTALGVATEIQTNMLDQYHTYMGLDQTLRAVYCKRLDTIHPKAIITLGTPYPHGFRPELVPDPRLAACMMYKTGSVDRSEWSKKYYGAITEVGFSAGRISGFLKSGLDGLGIWLMTHYGYPSIDKPTLIVWSKNRWATTLSRDQATTRVTSVICSDRIAVVHSRRTGHGI